MAVAFAAQFFVGHGGNFDVEVNAIEQRAADLGKIALNDARRAAAFAGGVAVEPAWARIIFLTANLDYISSGKRGLRCERGSGYSRCGKSSCRISLPLAVS